MKLDPDLYASDYGYNVATTLTQAADALSCLAGEGWQPMDSAPKEGKHVLLCVKSGPFFYAVEGSFRGPDGWLAAFVGKVEPVYWAWKPKGFALPHAPSVEEKLP